jgi:hypothetical protein
MPDLGGIGFECCQFFLPVVQSTTDRGAYVLVFGVGDTSEGQQLVPCRVIDSE